MEELYFEWDENKNKSNLEKHGIDFVQTKEVFADEIRIETIDSRINYGELRIKTIGKAGDLILSVIFTKRNNAIRIISARAASKKERNDYNDGSKQ